MIDLELQCLYCGHEWAEKFWSPNPSVECPGCKETKHIKAHQVEEANKDIYGYRHSPPFEEPKQDEFKVDDQPPAWKEKETQFDFDLTTDDFERFEDDGGFHDHGNGD